MADLPSPPQSVCTIMVPSSVADPDPVFFGHPDPDPDPLSTKRPHVIQIFSL